jgi:hypothetical protein
MTAQLTSPATLQMGAMRSDGRLSLNEHGLSFRPMSQSLSLGALSIALVDIVQVEQCIAKGAGFLPISEQAMRVSLISGKCYEFVLADQDKWVEVLTQAIS